jgi:hypothetical protein
MMASDSSCASVADRGTEHREAHGPADEPGLAVATILDP